MGEVNSKPVQGGASGFEFKKVRLVTSCQTTLTASYTHMQIQQNRDIFQ